MDEVKEIVFNDGKFFDLKSGKELVITNSYHVIENDIEKFVITFEELTI